MIGRGEIKQTDKADGDAEEWRELREVTRLRVPEIDIRGK